MHATESESQTSEDKDFETIVSSEPFYTVTQYSEVSKPEIQHLSDDQITNVYEENYLSGKEETKPQKKTRICPCCPPQGRLNKIITNGVLLFMIWCISWSLIGSLVLPGGSLFGLLVIFYSAVIGGKLLQLIRIRSVPPLPPLLGMLLAGFLIRNVPFISKHVRIHTTWSSTLRNTALTIILIRAGLGLDPQALKNLKGVCLRLSVGPCIMEACSAAVFARLIMKFPWEWGFLLGFVLGAVSPAVVVPSMLLLQENGYGVEKGIPTLLVAASSLDDILAITGFNTCLSIVFSPGGVLFNIISSIRDVLIGVLIGTILGIFVHFFPSKDQSNLPLKRAMLILSMCISAVLGSHRIGLHTTGGLCTLTMSFIAGTSWSKEKVRVQTFIKATWDVFQPLLFGLVGSEISMSTLEANKIGICVATLSLALCVRILITFLLMCFAGFSFKEKIFIALSWMPKATVQAVLGPLALEAARLTAPHLEAYSKDVMTVAFLAILITAPNGALFIGILGPKILARHYDPNKIKLHLSAAAHH
ncbi:sodium/hydrogen exchanger 9B1 isoform X1 [Ochotona princeps]|uniref:sodium/hydrogen exchanger 9B1 isoform X1 n=2 Tax=Ochotona princeps TaxID=9978 RepID=UPI002714C57C|nr:sodium/hydrogen exchanger 9B1 isoform X1 [Ochotona princeps]XP_058522964.1 sodium/hydrogen exchanger 9B1 isoform X1 [Ochotona princeps]